MWKTKILYIIIILGLTMFIISNMSPFLPSGRNFTILGSINVITQKVDVDNRQTVLDNENDNNNKKVKTVTVKSGDTVLPASDSNNGKTTIEDDKSSKQTPQEDTKIIKDNSSQSADKNAKETEAKISNEATLKPCPERGSKLVGPLFIDQEVPSSNDEKTLGIDYGGTVENGGWWAPPSCIPRVKVAIIIPYRKREKQLKIFLRHMHPFLQKQKLFYRIIVVDQLSDDPFNRAGLFNVGFVESLKLSSFNCFVFSDVDLLPEDDRNYYGCPTSPRHMSVAVDKFNYRLPYSTIFGGVGAFTKKHFEEINGMSNLFWGWGGEDDDLYARITSHGLRLTRPSLLVGRYTMIRIHHFQSSKADPNRGNLLQTSKKRMFGDGLNTLKYHLKEVIEEPLVTFVKIEMKKNDYVQQL